MQIMIRNLDGTLIDLDIDLEKNDKTIAQALKEQYGLTDQEVGNIKLLGEGKVLDLNRPLDKDSISAIKRSDTLKIVILFSASSDIRTELNKKLTSLNKNVLVHKELEEQRNIITPLSSPAASSVTASPELSPREISSPVMFSAGEGNDDALPNAAVAEKIITAIDDDILAIPFIPYEEKLIAIEGLKNRIHALNPRFFTDLENEIIGVYEKTESSSQEIIDSLNILKKAVQEKYLPHEHVASSDIASGSVEHSRIAEPGAAAATTSREVKKIGQVLGNSGLVENTGSKRDTMQAPQVTKTERSTKTAKGGCSMM